MPSSLNAPTKPAVTDTPCVDQIPCYEPDEGPLTEEQVAQIRACVPQGQQLSIRTSVFQV